MRVLIVEDNAALGTLLVRVLQEEGFTVSWAQDGDAALLEWQEGQFALLLLDLSLPRRDGLEVLETIRRTSDAAVLVLTGRNSLEERLRCLELGADNFLAKPFAPRELQMHCRALLRRFRTGSSAALRCGDLVLDRTNRKVERAGRSIDLTLKEFSLLEYLLEHRGECVSRAGLLQHVWKMHPDVSTNVVDVYINYLRRKIEEGFQEKLIHTVRGSGYVLRHSSPEAACRRFGARSFCCFLPKLMCEVLKYANPKICSGQRVCSAHGCPCKRRFRLSKKSC